MSVLTLEDLKDMADIFNVVQEPGYSEGKLREYQRKYSLDTATFVYNYIHSPESLIHIEEKDKIKWFYNWRIFTEANGKMSDLIKSFFDDMSTDYFINWDFESDNGQAIIRGEQQCSPSLLITLKWTCIIFPLSSFPVRDEKVA